MVTVQKVKVPNSDRIGLIIRGHANYVKRGPDIVCSAVSTIAQSCVLGCQTYGTNTDVKQLREGYVSFTTDFSQITMALVNTAYKSLQQLAIQYPECFKEIE